ncbi:MAG: hypothetical protein GVX96_00790 [Bacteroidetes bacterium]|jgi:hypothetical protein|nr:hypothetical protein [Bacteroidota bacterium]
MKTPYFFFFLLIFACHTGEKEKVSSYSAELQVLPDSAYPDNPDRSLRHPDFGRFSFNEVHFPLEGPTLGGLELVNPQSKDTLLLTKLDWSVWMPRLQSRLAGHDYLSTIGIVNQEWNRHQITLLPEQVHFTGDEKKAPKRVDVARNCLQSGLWEIILFDEHEGHDAPLYHGWFSFPDTLYKKLFNEMNPEPFDTYASALKDWEDPQLKIVNFDALRQVDREIGLSMTSHNQGKYPLTGERKKKFSNIIYPPNSTRISDFLTDSTRFATFTPPGKYTRSDPRETELGRLAHPESCIGRSWINEDGEKCFELQIKYGKDRKNRRTNFYISGLRTEDIPRLKEKHLDHGLQRPMGIGNPSFYQNYKEAADRKADTDPYFALLTDGEGRWLDSHAVGIDGPLLHWDAEDSHLLHVWVLSFERHAFVGHYTVDTRPLIKINTPELQEHFCWLDMKKKEDERRSSF